MIEILEYPRVQVKIDNILQNLSQLARNGGTFPHKKDNKLTLIALSVSLVSFWSGKGPNFLVVQGTWNNMKVPIK